ncbi:hypothetical protein PsYK624_055420 [Phanerochaete sordida]|uniref:Uncharacterized protein n=1 Tax=Phanerochaete sordida TaxID=48140 RepID=A0A9P3LBF8_9APHY|nr:hypothetical protein PsYK624_055420 [Phanerochaete sordida]
MSEVSIIAPPAGSSVGCPSCSSSPSSKVCPARTPQRSTAAIVVKSQRRRCLDPLLPSKTYR